MWYIISKAARQTILNIEEHKQEDVKTNANCCFDHIIGWPYKDSTDKPLYDYAFAYSMV